MPKQQLENLMTRLHDAFASTEVSPQQQQLLDDLYLHLETGNNANTSLKDSANLVLEELEIDHPKAAVILREVIETLGRLGL
ncbi:MAG: DUF4404 family protein [Pseudomonadales bacterium]|nr:DUF4404 family protein [Pseudomonadales bacterium]